MIDGGESREGYSHRTYLDKGGDACECDFLYEPDERFPILGNVA